jgi:hypothetical protein
VTEVEPTEGLGTLSGDSVCSAEVLEVAKILSLTLDGSSGFGKLIRS